MTKEELKQEAEEWLCNNLHSAIEEDFIKAMVDIAEPREKRIEELIALINAERERQEKCDDVHLRTIADLEKENAELKDYRLTTLAKQQTGMSKYALNLEHKLSWYDDQLTKAKELLKDWMQTSKASGCDNINIVTDTEQFISEVEK